MVHVSTRVFKLQFDPAEIPILVEAYHQGEDDDGALAAGRHIRGGDTSRDHLKTIFVWKTKGRGQTRLCRNSDAEIADALTMAVGAQTERAAVAVLVGLNGVLVPVASAILTAIYPERFTVIDFRALEALGIERPDPTINFYLSYLKACRELAEACQVTLRDLDRALWQWSSSRK